MAISWKCVNSSEVRIHVLDEHISSETKFTGCISLNVLMFCLSHSYFDCCNHSTHQNTCRKKSLHFNIPEGRQSLIPTRDIDEMSRNPQTRKVSLQQIQE